MDAWSCARWGRGGFLRSVHGRGDLYRAARRRAARRPRCPVDGGPAQRRAFRRRRSHPRLRRGEARGVLGQMESRAARRGGNRVSRVDQSSGERAFAAPGHGGPSGWRRRRFRARARSSEPALSASPSASDPRGARMIDHDAFRAVMGRFASGVTVVTSVDADGFDEGMTVSAFCSLSLDPPMVLFCVDRIASMFESLATAPGFIVNILSESQEALARRFSGPDPNRFEGIGYTRGSSGPVILEDVLGYLECRRVAAYEGGDHRIYVGEVEAAQSKEGRPLLYYRGGYAQLER